MSIREELQELNDLMGQPFARTRFGKLRAEVRVTEPAAGQEIVIPGMELQDGSSPTILKGVTESAKSIKEKGVKVILALLMEQRTQDGDIYTAWNAQHNWNQAWSRKKRGNKADFVGLFDTVNDNAPQLLDGESVFAQIEEYSLGDWYKQPADDDITEGNAGWYYNSNTSEWKSPNQWRIVKVFASEAEMRQAETEFWASKTSESGEPAMAIPAGQNPDSFRQLVAHVQNLVNQGLDFETAMKGIEHIDPEVIRKNITMPTTA